MSHYQITYKGTHTGWRRSFFGALPGTIEPSPFTAYKIGSDGERVFVGSTATRPGAMRLIRRNYVTTTEDVIM